MGLSEVPEIVVYNKADALEPDMRCEFENLEEGVLVSGQTKEGLAELIEEIKRQLVNLGR